jgi:hypothetical protein
MLTQSPFGTVSSQTNPNIALDDQLFVGRLRLGAGEDFLKSQLYSNAHGRSRPYGLSDAHPEVVNRRTNGSVFD